MTTESISRIYTVLLYGYPKEFRARFGEEMQQALRDRWRASAGPAPFRLYVSMLQDWALSCAKERIASMSTTWNSRGAKAVRGLAVALGMLLICLMASAPFVHAYVINGTSMKASLQLGDHLIIHNLGPDAAIERDEMIVLRSPLDSKQVFVKRVIGLPGDRIRLSNKQVIRNGRRLLEPYALHVTSYTEAFRDNFPGTPNVTLPEGGPDMLEHHVVNGEVVVPPGTLFVLGDNRDDSLDSRYWGFLPRPNVVGRPLFIYWSYDATTGKTRWNRTMKVLPVEHPAEVAP
jgi:signal peptidase I